MANHCKFITDTYTVEGNDKVYDFNNCLSYIEYQGRAQYGQSFKINEVDCPIFYKLLIYMIKDQSEASKLKIDLSKGILLSGPVGCGKTSIMHLIRPFSVMASDYKIKTCREIAYEFAKRGYEALQPYTQKSNNMSRLHGYCFDDLGAEQQIKHFGNECNVMAEIILTRYDSFIHNKTMTHVTTNLSASELEGFYGDRVRSRMRQMFNLIAFDKDSIDKR